MQAREAYEAAVKLEPDDQHLRSALQKALTLESRDEAEKRHRFKRKHEGGGGGGGGQQEQQQQRKKQEGSGKGARKGPLSFGGDEEDGDG